MYGFETRVEVGPDPRIHDVKGDTKFHSFPNKRPLHLRRGSLVEMVSLLKVIYLHVSLLVSAIF